MESNEELFLKDVATTNRNSFVYGYIDLFSGYGESWNWGLGMDETSGKISPVPPSKLDASEHVYDIGKNKSDRTSEPPKMQDTKQGPFVMPAAESDTSREGSEKSNKSMASCSLGNPDVVELIANGSENEKEVSVMRYVYFCLCVAL